MPTVQLPDGKDLVFDKKVNGFEISEKISKSLSKQALVMSVNGQLKDLSETIENDCIFFVYVVVLNFSSFFLNLF
mgnify:CR=1 FL=1